MMRGDGEVVFITSNIEKTNIKTKIIERDTERDNYLNADEALKYGIVDKIVTSNA